MTAARKPMPTDDIEVQALEIVRQYVVRDIGDVSGELRLKADIAAALRAEHERAYKQGYDVGFAAGMAEPARKVREFLGDQVEGVAIRALAKPKEANDGT